MKKIILIVATILLTMACSKDENEPKTPTVNNEPFTFLKVGNEWVYEIRDNPNETTTISIVSEENDYFKVIYNITFEDEYPREFTYYWYTDSGNYWKNDILDVGMDGIIWLYKNSYVGQIWEPENSVICTIEVVSVSERVVVPAGTFNNCIKIKKTNIYGIVGYIWIHKDVGQIMGTLPPLKLKSKNFK